jgi:hypothetical protein
MTTGSLDGRFGMLSIGVFVIPVTVAVVIGCSTSGMAGAIPGRPVSELS